MSQVDNGDAAYLFSVSVLFFTTVIGKEAATTSLSTTPVVGDRLAGQIVPREESGLNPRLRDHRSGELSLLAIWINVAETRKAYKLWD